MTKAGLARLVRRRTQLFLLAVLFVVPFTSRSASAQSYPSERAYRPVSEAGYDSGNDDQDQKDDDFKTKLGIGAALALAGLVAWFVRRSRAEEAKDLADSTLPAPLPEELASTREVIQEEMARIGGRPMPPPPAIPGLAFHIDGTAPMVYVFLPGQSYHDGSLAKVQTWLTRMFADRHRTTWQIVLVGPDTLSLVPKRKDALIAIDTRIFGFSPSGAVFAGFEKSIEGLFTRIVDRLRAAKAEQSRHADTKTCPMCAESVKAAAKICRYCQYRFDDQGRADATGVAMTVTEAAIEARTADGPSTPPRRNVGAPAASQPDTSRGAGSGESPASSTHPCPKCSGLIHPKATTCMHCWAKVPQS